MRKFVVLLLLFAIGYVVYGDHLGLQPKLASNKEPFNKPKNVIFMIGDGMGHGQMEVARTFEYGKNGRLFMETLQNVALVHTYSADNMVTDSAAAGTALATGVKTNNEMIGITPDKQEVDSILDKFKQDGKKVGIISTSSVTDATPAAFTASVLNRWNNQSDIAKQQLTSEIDVILGGGGKHFEGVDSKGLDLLSQYKESGYHIVNNRSQLLKAEANKLLGLFNSAHMNFKIDRDELKSKEPSLTEMTKKTLTLLNKDQKGFFVMIEGARIDHASHSSDLTSIWKETIEFDHAVKYAVNWAKNHGETLVIVVADHETMGVTLTEPTKISQLKKMTVSPTFMYKQLQSHQQKFDEKRIKMVFKTYANINLSKNELNSLKKVWEDRNKMVYKDSQIAWEIGSIIAKHNHVGINSNMTRLLSSTGGHTGNPVPLFAYGAGSERFKGVLNNTDVPKIIAELMNYQL